MKELIRKVKSIYEEYSDDSDKLSSEIKQLNISRDHLIRLFRQHFQMTPVEYTNKLRIEKAVELLSQGTMNSLSIAIACGFGSLSNFYVCFKRQVGITPNEYRRTMISSSAQSGFH